MATFEHPGNGHRERVTLAAGLLALLFGLFYFLVKGAWQHALLQLAVLAVGGLALGPAVAVLMIPLWLGYALAAPAIMRARYLRAGWRQVD